MQWIASMLGKYPELAVFLVVGVGYWMGGFRFRGFGLGPVTWSLLVGLLVGSLFSVPVSAAAKSILFLLFLFAIGYSVGPKFFQVMKGDGWALLAIVMASSGLAAAYAVSLALQLDAGFAAGLVAGALTESPAIGTATEAINALSLSEADRNRLISHVAVGDAVCYVFGAFGVILFCSVVGPRLLRIDLVGEAATIERRLGMDRVRPGVFSAWRPFEWRAYRLCAGGRVAGWTVAQAEAMIPGARVFIERIRRDGQLIGELRIALGTSVGTLLSGLLVGYLHSKRPLFGRIPEGAVVFMISLGLAAFVGMIGLGAGPHFVEGVRDAGVGLFFGGIVVTLVPLFVGLYFGRYALKLDPVLLLGGIAGAQTMTAGLAAVQERSASPVAVLGYSGTVAIGHILLTTWGTVIVRLLA